MLIDTITSHPKTDESVLRLLLYRYDFGWSIRSLLKSASQVNRLMVGNAYRIGAGPHLVAHPNADGIHLCPGK